MKLKTESADINPDTIDQLFDLKQRLAHQVALAPCPDPSLAKSLVRKKFESRQRLFFATTDSADFANTQAAVVARVSPTIIDAEGSAVGMLGFFDAFNRPAPVTEMLGQSIQWLRQQGCRSIVGPIDGDTWHKYRINVGPHDDSPFLLEPTNPEYYSKLFLGAGFEVVDRYHSLRVEDIAAIAPMLKPAYDAASQRDYCLRPIRLEHFEDELKIIFEISKQAFDENFLYDDISWPEFLSLYAGAKPLIRPELVWFVVDTTGSEVGFLFCMIDYYNAVSAMKGKTGLLAKLRFLINRSSAQAVNFKSIAILPAHRQSKLAGALMYQGYVESLKLGYTQANLCLIRDGNPSARLDGGNSRILRRYELYQSPGSKLKPNH
jgi:hypothetical protein